jgi:DNA polymerase III epsilon subunit family exonuclease
MERRVRTHPVRVAIDLETTGLHPEQDTVVEVGAVKFAGEEVLDRFESFVSTSAHLPYRIQRLTGIAPAQLKHAPPLAEIIPRLRTFLGDHPLVGHSVPFDAAFLRRMGLAQRNPLLDTYELASALLPNLPSYTLASVGTELGVSSPTYHRALADAELAHQVFLALLARLDALDGTTLDALERLATPPDWTPGYLVRTTARSQRAASGVHSIFGGGTLGEQLAAKLGIDPAALALAISDEGAAPARRRTTVALAADAPDGEAAPGEGHRMITASVAGCLGDGGALAVEVENDLAGLRACLTPALRWAGEHEGRLLISVANAESMARVITRALPAAFVSAGLDPEALPIAELVEQEAYLCLHRWFGAAREARNGVLPRDIARGLAKLTVWASQTRTGVRSEVSLAGQEAVAWERAQAGADFADSSDTCIYRRDGYCFVTRATNAARDARIVVTTHAALAAHLAGNDERLPEATHVLVLDAHLLEEELRRARSATLDRQEVLAALANLAEVETGGRHCGLLHMAASRAGSAGGPAREQTWFAQVEKARKSVEAVFTALRSVIAEAQGEQASGKGNGVRTGDSPEQRTLRVDGAVRQLRTWEDAVRAWRTLTERLGGLTKLARETARAIIAVKGSKATPASDGIATDLLAAARALDRICAQGEAIFTGAADDNRVQWLRIPYAPTGSQQPAGAGGNRSGARDQHPEQQRHGHGHQKDKEPPKAATAAVGGGQAVAEESSEMPVLHSAPIHVSALLERVWAPEHALVLASPALAVAGDFSYTSGCLGLPESTRTLGPAIDRAEQTLLCLPADVPEPNASQYQRHLDEALVMLAAALGGRLVAIFPSHAALRTSAQGIRRALERHDILVLAQGQDGSARQLWHTFRTEQRIVLLGAGTFWDGAEQPAQPPACVVVTRVPFPALSDPLLAARAETWSDPQNQFVVPHSALRVRQALGGLAWSHRQRNAVVLFDRRLQTRGYGPTILGTLPRCTQYQEPMAHIAERVAEWVEA